MTDRTSESRGRAETRRASERRAQAQVVMREVNEQTHKLDTPAATAGVVFCECCDRECLRELPIPKEAYEEIRRYPGRFIVAPGHQHPSEDRVVEDHGVYLVVEKVGPGAIAAIRLDPRRR